MQSIFTAYRHPFVLTYLGVSLMVIYLPIAVVKDWVCNHFRRLYSLEKRVLMDTSLEIICLKNHPVVPIPNGIELIESDPKLLLCREDVQVAKFKDTIGFSEKTQELTPLDLALKSFCLAPLWFLTEV